MPHEVIMPALGMAQDTGQLVAWLKKPGDPVKIGEPIMQVETDKATMEVEAQADGFLVDLRAVEGTDVPVGDVVALISDTAEDGGGAATGSAPDTTDAAPAAGSDDGALPEGESVIMPALGMAQDTGRVVGWSVAPGARVGADDPLLEVETDKSVMEVPAGVDGYLAAVLAAEGEDVPVGDVIAIVTAEPPDAPLVRSRAEGSPDAAPATAPVDPPDTPEALVAAPAPSPAKAPAADPGGRILASPKARRLAAEEGLDLARLVAEGVAQPFHVADLATLRTLPDPTPAAQPATTAPSRRLTATVPAAPLDAFLDWAAGEVGAQIPRAAALASFAAASLRDGDAAITVAVDDPLTGARHLYADPDRTPLADLTQGAEGAPDLILRDLTATAITSVHLGADPVPALSLSREGDTLTLTCEGTLEAARAIALMNGFAGRLADPLRHLL